MIHSDPETELRSTLTTFETSVTTPVVSGELSDWIEKARKTWVDCSRRVREHSRELHPRQYEQIAEADAALYRQVELLRAEDEEIERARDKLDHTISRMNEWLPKVEPDEAKAQPHVQNLMEQGIAFVSRVRKQEVAVQTWFAEAFNRERGGGD
jgi:hypothetical protein